MDTVLEEFSVWYRPWDNYKRLNQAIEMLFGAIAEFCNLDLPMLDVNIERDNTKKLSFFLKKRRNDGGCGSV